MSTDAYAIGRDRAITAQWRAYRIWVRRASKSTSTRWAEEALALADTCREKATEMEAQIPDYSTTR